MPFVKGKTGKAASTDQPERVAQEMLLTGTRDYWMQACHKSIAYLEKRIYEFTSTGQKTPRDLESLAAKWRAVYRALEKS